MMVFAACCSRILAPASCASKRFTVTSLLVGTSSWGVEYQSEGTVTYRRFVNVDFSDDRITDLEVKRCSMMNVKDERCRLEDLVCGCGNVEGNGGVMARLHLCCWGIGTMRRLVISLPRAESFGIGSNANSGEGSSSTFYGA